MSGTILGGYLPAPNQYGELQTAQRGFTLTPALEHGSDSIHPPPRLTGTAISPDISPEVANADRIASTTLLIECGSFVSVQASLVGIMCDVQLVSDATRLRLLSARAVGEMAPQVEPNTFAPTSRVIFDQKEYRVFRIAAGIPFDAYNRETGSQLDRNGDSQVVMKMFNAGVVYAFVSILNSITVHTKSAFIHNALEKTSKFSVQAASKPGAPTAAAIAEAWRTGAFVGNREVGSSHGGYGKAVGVDLFKRYTRTVPDSMLCGPAAARGARVVSSQLRLGFGDGLSSGTRPDPNATHRVTEQESLWLRFLNTSENLVTKISNYSLTAKTPDLVEHTRALADILRGEPGVERRTTGSGEPFALHGGVISYMCEDDVIKDAVDETRNVAVNALSRAVVYGLYGHISGTALPAGASYFAKIPILGPGKTVDVPLNAGRSHLFVRQVVVRVDGAVFFTAKDPASALILTRAGTSTHLRDFRFATTLELFLHMGLAIDSRAMMIPDLASSGVAFGGGKRMLHYEASPDAAADALAWSAAEETYKADLAKMNSLGTELIHVVGDSADDIIAEPGGDIILHVHGTPITDSTKHLHPDLRARLEYRDHHGAVRTAPHTSELIRSMHQAGTVAANSPAARVAKLLRRSIVNYTLPQPASVVPLKQGFSSVGPRSFCPHLSPMRITVYAVAPGSSAQTYVPGASSEGDSVFSGLDTPEAGARLTDPSFAFRQSMAHYVAHQPIAG